MPALPGQADLAWYGYPAHQPPASGTALASGGPPGSLPFSPPRSPGALTVATWLLMASDAGFVSGTE